MNFKDEEKLAIPVWFNLGSYAPLKGFATPQPWLEQFALRIDLMAHWRDAVRENPNCEPYQWLGRVDESYPEDLLFDVLKSPLPSVRDLVDSLSHVDFPTLTLVKHCAESVRPMTALDLMRALIIVPSATRKQMALFDPELMQAFSHVSDPVDSTQGQESQAVQWDLSSRLQAPAAYPQHLSKLWLMIQMAGGIDSWMIKPFAQSYENDSVTYCAVDTSVPLRDAERAFRKYFIQAQTNKCNSSRMDSSTFAKWCDDGILPYIDLKIYEAIERFRQKRFVSITEETMASAIYPILPGVPPRASTCVSDTTRPVAEDLQNPFSARFRLLISRAAERDAQSNGGIREG